MIPRSWLFVPGDSERKYDRAQASGADALILDLEVLVAENKAAAARRPGRRRRAATGNSRRTRARHQRQPMADPYKGADPRPDLYRLGHAGLKKHSNESSATQRRIAVAVRALVDRWFAPTQRWFKVEADDGNQHVLHKDDASGDWEIAAFRRTAD